MIQEVSAGGMVVFGNTVLLLKKFNGDWVLPKGRVENNETIEEAALREVYEESGVKADIESYICKIKYRYKNLKEDDIVEKTVYWYLMTCTSMNSLPQKNEGFIDAVFVHIDKAQGLARYKDEKKVINKGIRMISRE